MSVKLCLNANEPSLLSFFRQATLNNGLSLKSLAADLLNVSLDKSLKLRCSDWEADQLTLEQVVFDVLHVFHTSTNIIKTIGVILDAAFFWESYNFQNDFVVDPLFGFSVFPRCPTLPEMLRSPSLCSSIFSASALKPVPLPPAEAPTPNWSPAARGWWMCRSRAGQRETTRTLMERRGGGHANC